LLSPCHCHHTIAVAIAAPLQLPHCCSHTTITSPLQLPDCHSAAPWQLVTIAVAHLTITVAAPLP